MYFVTNFIEYFNLNIAHLFVFINDYVLIFACHFLIE